MQYFKISVPCSSANIGPGFDVLGLALSSFLELEVKVDMTQDHAEDPNNCKITYEGEGSDGVPLSSDKNLITRVALYVLRCNQIRTFPIGTHVHVKNPIPLGRGLGSSGAAVVAGVMLGNELGKLKFDKNRMMDYCLMIERHPDNIAAAMKGGFVGSFLRELSGTDLERIEIPLTEVLPETSGGADTGLTPPEPPQNISHSITYDWSDKVKAVVIIPDFEVSTADARSVLPTAYTRQDAIYNLQRLSVLTAALARDPPSPELIYPAMQDKLHQPYRKILIPGLPEVLQSMTPNTHEGLLGICLSGAGPTILALATDNFEGIASEIIKRFEKKNIKCSWRLLEVAKDGAVVTHL